MSFPTPRKPRNRTFAKIIIWVFPGMFILGGLTALWFATTLFYQSQTCKSWPTAEGSIISSTVRTTRDSKGRTWYRPKIVYRYQAEGRTYTNSQLAYGTMSSSSSWAHEIVARYPQGSRTSAHYDPRHPEEAVLETGVHGGLWICLGVGSLFTTFGFLFLFGFSLRVWRTQQFD